MSRKSRAAGAQHPAAVHVYLPVLPYVAVSRLFPLYFMLVTSLQEQR